MAQRSFAERAETTLILAIFVGILLVAQRWSVNVFRAGLVILVVSTFLQIAVGNLPKHLAVGPSLKRIAMILTAVAAMFVLGIVLVPFLAELGR